MRRSMPSSGMLPCRCDSNLGRPPGAGFPETIEMYEMTTTQTVLRFWFEEHGGDDWFQGGEVFDDKIRDRFLEVYEGGAAGGLDAWQGTALGCVALCLVLDQFPRNLFRGDPRSFATDAAARAVTNHAIAQGFDLDPALDADHRMFLYLPLEHSEDLADQRQCVDLVRERIGNERYIDFAVRHLEIIERFGRFPHRNAVLGRTSTDEEIEFLKQPGSGF